MGNWPRMGQNTLLIKFKYVKNVLINKSPLNTDVNSQKSFQKMQTPLFMFYLKFLCNRHTNSKLATLLDVAEGYIWKFSIKSPSSFLLYFFINGVVVTKVSF